MKILQQYLVPLVIGVFCTGFSSYHILAGGESNLSYPAEPSTTSQAAPSPSSAPRDFPPTNNPKNLTKNDRNAIALNIYHPDSQCQTLIPEKVTVSAETPITHAVGKVLESSSSSDFDLAGYRVNLDLNKRIVTIDFRLAPNSQRQFVSLSMCEQFALFGSLRKTLLDNPQLKIKDVRFTHQGREIKL